MDETEQKTPAPSHPPIQAVKAPRRVPATPVSRGAAKNMDNRAVRGLRPAENDK